jgi:hypothetical protein
MGLEINNDIFRLQNLSVDGMSRREYRLHLEIIADLESMHVDTVAA